MSDGLVSFHYSSHVENMKQGKNSFMIRIVELAEAFDIEKLFLFEIRA